MLIKKIRNKILKEMRLEQKEKFIQCLVGAGVWDEINVRRRWEELEVEAKKKANKNAREYKKKKRLEEKSE